MVKGKTIEALRVDEEFISPEEYLNLEDDEKREIKKVIPLVKGLGEIPLEDSNFVGLKVQYKRPKYNFEF